MRSEWQEKKLGDLLTLEYGKPLLPSERKAAGKYAVYGANGIKDRSDRFYSDKPSIIVGRKGSAGEITLTEDKFWPLDVTYFVAFDKSKYDLQFLYHLLSLQELPKLAKGVKPGINRNEVYAKTVRVPPLPEQQRIVAVLDEAFAGLATATANAEKNLKNARELFESYLNSVFANTDGWLRSPVRQVATKIGSGATPTGGEKSYKKKGIPLIRSLNVYDRRFKVDDLAFLDDIQAKKLEGVTVQSGDVLLNITGASVARCCLAPDGFLPARVNQHVSIIRPIQSTILPRFLEFGLTAKVNKDRLLGVGENAGATRQAITKAQIQEFIFSYPPLDFQRVIVNKLNDIGVETGKLEARHKDKLKALANLKKSILQKAFSGELTSPPSQALKEAAE